MNLAKLSMPPLKPKNRLYKVMGTAIADKRYRWGIRLTEKYARHHSLSENETYKLALLYDHLAMKMKQTKKSKTRKTELMNGYLKKAEELYRGILKTNPKYLHANYGIGRVYSIRGDYDTAIRYQVEAFKQMMKLPRNQRGALAIGSLYERKGDLRNAERWYLKEYRVCAKNNFGTACNLFLFYKRIRDYPKALRYAKKTEQLLKREFKRNAYRGIKMKSSKSIKFTEKEIEDLKKKTGLQLE